MIAAGLASTNHPTRRSPPAQIRRKDARSKTAPRPSSISRIQKSLAGNETEWKMHTALPDVKNTKWCRTDASAFCLKLPVDAACGGLPVCRGGTSRIARRWILCRVPLRSCPGELFTSTWERKNNVPWLRMANHSPSSIPLRTPEKRWNWKLEAKNPASITTKMMRAQEKWGQRSMDWWHMGSALSFNQDWHLSRSLALQLVWYNILHGSYHIYPLNKSHHCWVRWRYFHLQMLAAAGSEIFWHLRGGMRFFSQGEGVMAQAAGRLQDAEVIGFFFGGEELSSAGFPARLYGCKKLQASLSKSFSLVSFDAVRCFKDL